MVPHMCKCNVLMCNNELAGLQPGCRTGLRPVLSTLLVQAL